ncbi:MAG: MFS transporter, partial [Armatimonadetes bacterium]|nr:MFS transporter [Armatimonadota bacterium]
MQSRAGAGQARYWLGLHPAVLSVSTFNFTLFLAWQISVPVVPLLALSLNASPFAVGMVVGSKAILPMLLAVPTGRLADRLPARGLQVSAALTMLAATALMWKAGSVLAMMVGQALIGLSVTVASVAGQAFIALATDRRERDAMYGRYTFIIALDNVLGPALGGLLAGWGGPRAGMLVASGFALASLPLAMWLPGERGAVAQRRPAQGRSSLELLRTPVVLFSLVAGFLFLFGYSLQASYYVVYLNHVGFDSRTIGLLLAVGGAATISIRPLLAWAAARVGRPRLLTVICVTLGVGLGLIPMAAGVVVGQAGLAIVTGLAYGLSQPLTITMISHAAPPESLGLAFGWRQIFQRAAELVGPLSIGLVVIAAGL